MNTLNSREVRQPAVAGMFYPNDPQQLRSMVRQFLQEAPAQEPAPIAIIAPHAGYVYSGYTAACAYKTLPKAEENQPIRVFLLSPSHRVYLDGVSVGCYRAYATPLGEVMVDQEMVQQMAALPDVNQDPAPHQQEHALEVHLPFLQETIGHFTLVPVVFGDISGGHLADIISKFWKPGDLLIASTDLSHFYPYEEAKQLDSQCHEAVLAIDPKAMSKTKACGNTGVCALLEMARRNQWRPVMADYRNSGDTAGDKNKVVGYASYLFYSGSGAAQNQPMTLPKLARFHLDRVLKGESGIIAERLMQASAKLAEKGACFVTLTKKGQLRGCIGSLEAHRSLASDLLENSVAAAMRDPRFPPVSAAELPELHIGISLLTPAKPFPYNDGNDLLRRLQPNVHGVILSKGGKRSTFLPQVWEQLPDPRTFLEHLCQKAGLNRDCWQDKPDIFVYTVEKIDE